MNYVLFILFAVAAYVGISAMGQLSGGAAHSAVDAGLKLFRPYAFALLLTGNLVWVVALYFGLKETHLALPALIAIGVLTSFVYSLVFLSAEISFLKIVGLLLILSGIYLLA